MCPAGPVSDRWIPPQPLISLPQRSQGATTGPTGGWRWGFIEKRSGRYRARYRHPLGRQRSETFTRKADAERFLREMQVDIERGRWIAPAGADVIDAERAALEAQLRSPRPNKGVMRAALRGVAWAAQAAGSGVVGAAALRALQLLG